MSHCYQSLLHLPNLLPFPSQTVVSVAQHNVPISCFYVPPLILFQCSMLKMATPRGFYQRQQRRRGRHLHRCRRRYRHLYRRRYRGRGGLERPSRLHRQRRGAQHLLRRFGQTTRSVLCRRGQKEVTPNPVTQGRRPPAHVWKVSAGPETGVGRGREGGK